MALEGPWTLEEGRAPGREGWMEAGGREGPREGGLAPAPTTWLHSWPGKQIYTANFIQSLKVVMLDRKMAHLNIETK